MSTLFVNPELEPASAVVGARVRVRGDEGRHAVTVNRIRTGETVSIGDGEGLVVTGAVVTAASDELVIEVAEVRTEPWPSPELWLVQALAKGDRDELAVQAATELGVTGVVPWAADRSVARWDGAKVAKGEARWRTITREASKQSLRAWLPQVAPLARTSDLARLAGETRMLLLDPTADTPLTAIDPAGAPRLHLVVGPEGGFAPAELDRLSAAGAERVHLGAGILRTSTAGPAALAVLNARLGRW